MSMVAEEDNIWRVAIEVDIMIFILVYNSSYRIIISTVNNIVID